MSEKRRDKKKRILRNGESQRKDGRYAYKYYDNAGNVQFVYSWKLEKGDRLPAGKRDDLALREKEREIKQRLEAKLIPQGGEITVLELVQKYISLKTGVRQNTKTGYNFVLNILKKEEFGKHQINSVRLSDAKLWLIKLQRDGRGYSTIHTVRGVVRPAFQMAVDDDWLHKNPFLDQNGNPTVAMHWEHYFNHICTSYNKLYREQLPNITPHVCRHTFCSNMAKSGMNPKTLQYLMGHSDIGVTLNTYTHVQYDDVETEMKRVVTAE